MYIIFWLLHKVQTIKKRKNLLITKGRASCQDIKTSHPWKWSQLPRFFTGKPAWSCSHFPPSLSSAVICLKHLKVRKKNPHKVKLLWNSLNERVTGFFTGVKRRKSSQGTLLSFDWKTVLVFHSVAARRWRRASTNHLHVPQIKLPLPNPVSTHRSEIQVGGGGGNCWPLHLLSGEKKEGFSFSSVSFRLFHHLGCN